MTKQKLWTIIDDQSSETLVGGEGGKNTNCYDQGPNEEKPETSPETPDPFPQDPDHPLNPL